MRPLDQRVTVGIAIETPNDSGGASLADTTVGTIWARFEPALGAVGREGLCMCMAGSLVG